MSSGFKKMTPRGVMIILIDIGATMLNSIKAENKTYFEKAKETAEWILSRKIFSSSTDRIILIAYGSTNTQNPDNFKNCHLYSENFESASFDHLRFICNEIQPNSNEIGSDSCYDAILLGLNCLKNIENIKNDAKSLVIISDGNCRIKSDSENSLEDLAQELINENIDAYAIGPFDESSAMFQIPKLMNLAGGRTFTFESILLSLSNFISREKTTRTNTKNWQIAPDISLPLVFSLKSAKETKKLNLKLSDEFGEKVVRVNQLNIENEDGEIEKFAKIPKSATNNDNESEETMTIKAKNLELKKEETCSGFYFGKSVIFLDEEIIKEKYNNHNFNDKQKGGCLKLIQFTKKQNIHSSFLMDEKCYTVLPLLTKKMKRCDVNSAKCLMTLIEEMNKNEIVAICRYAYNISSNLQLLALIPHFNEQKNVLHLRAVFLPFFDDIKMLRFPKFGINKKGKQIEEEEEVMEDNTKPTIAQEAAIDDLIDLMDFDSSTTDLYTKGGILDPQYQLQCHFIKNKIMNPTEKAENHLENAKELVSKILKPRNDAIEENEEFFKRFKNIFNLSKVEKVKRESIKLEIIDMESIIDEWQQKKGEDSPTEKKRKTEKSRREELEEEFYENAENAAESACKNSLKTIKQMCQFPENASRNEFFKLLHKELALIRELCVFYAQIPSFNSMLTTIRNNDEYRPFADILGDSKDILPIHHQDLGGSLVTVEEAYLFWEEK